MMTRKHFEALAAALRENRPALDYGDYHESFCPEQWSDIAGRVADVCAHFNPHFDRTRFLKACGVEESV